MEAEADLKCRTRFKGNSKVAWIHSDIKERIIKSKIQQNKAQLESNKSDLKQLQLTDKFNEKETGAMRGRYKYEMICQKYAKAEVQRKLTTKRPSSYAISFNKDANQVRRQSQLLNFRANQNIEMGLDLVQTLGKNV